MKPFITKRMFIFWLLVFFAVVVSIEIYGKGENYFGRYHTPNFKDWKPPQR